MWGEEEGRKGGSRGLGVHPLWKGGKKGGLEGQRDFQAARRPRGSDAIRVREKRGRVFRSLFSGCGSHSADMLPSVRETPGGLSVRLRRDSLFCA